MNTISPPAAAEAIATARQARWTVSQVEALYQMPLMDLLFKAQQIHRENFNPNEVQRSALLSIKTGGCPEDCSYCSQSARYKATEREALMEVEEVLEAAKKAKAAGATRFCMGAAWRGPKEKELEVVTNMIREVKSLGMEACVTLGMLQDGQAEKLKEAGIVMNGQIVLCKGFNDGSELDRTLSDLSKYRPAMQSVSVVPVGLTRYRRGLEKPVRRSSAGNQPPVHCLLRFEACARHRASFRRRIGWNRARR